MPTITSKTQLTDRIAEFALSVDAPDAWTAGAHIDVETTAGTRSYSLIRWPGEDTRDHTIAVQREPDGDGGSAAMHMLETGAKLTITAPKNSFELAGDSAPSLLLAGGIGVTPLISMATDLAAQNRDFEFHYAGRSADQMAYLDRLNATFPDQFTAHFDDQTPLDLATTLSGKTNHHLYICGPKGMIDAARAAAEAAGFANDHIHVELFETPPQQTGDTAFEVEIADSGQVIQVGADQTIIEALEDAGLDLIYDCQRGDCGICQTDVISGTPDHRDVVLSQAEKDSGKVMQICVSRALSDRLVLDV